MKTILISFITSLCAMACASTPTVDDSSSTKVDLEASQSFKPANIASKFTTGVVDYKFEGKPFKAQWLQCVLNQGAPFVAFFHGDVGGNNPHGFCEDWNAQVLLKNGFNVIAVNRPSFNGSNGKDDLGGPQSVAASMEAFKASLGKGNLIGFWGIESGVIAATFVAKLSPHLKWLILGSGYYDLESLERSSKNERLLKNIALLKKNESESAFERRSIAWDIAGLPKVIAIYHSKNDDSAPKQQADDFNTQLRTAETKVFYNEIDAPAGGIPWQAQYQIVDKAIKQLTKGK